MFNKVSNWTEINRTKVNSIKAWPYEGHLRNDILHSDSELYTEKVNAIKVEKARGYAWKRVKEERVTQSKLLSTAWKVRAGKCI